MGAGTIFGIFFFLNFAPPTFKFAHPGYSVLGGQKCIVAQANHLTLNENCLFMIIQYFFCTKSRVGSRHPNSFQGGKFRVAMPTRIISRVGTCPPCPHRAGAYDEILFKLWFFHFMSFLFFVDRGERHSENKQRVEESHGK